MNKDTTEPKEPIDNISPINKKAVVRTNIILNHIRKNPMITPYRLSKDLEIDYTTINRTIKELIFCNAITYKVVIAENNRANKLLYVPIKESEKDE